MRYIMFLNEDDLLIRRKRRTEEEKAKISIKTKADKLLYNKWIEWRNDHKDGFDEDDIALMDFNYYRTYTERVGESPTDLKKHEARPVFLPKSTTEDTEEIDQEFEEIFSKLAYDYCTSDECKDKPIDFQPTNAEEIKNPVYKNIFSIFQKKVKDKFKAKGLFEFNKIYQEELKHVDMKGYTHDGRYSPAQAMKEAWIKVHVTFSK